MIESKNNKILGFKNIGKNFDGIKALDDVSFSIESGEIHGLIGENGAGKSTLIKICTGIYRSDTGKIILNHKEVSFRNPIESERAGIRVVHQDVSKILCLNLTIADNIFLGPNLERKGFFFLDRKRMDLKAREVLNRLGVNLDPGLKVEEISPALKQLTLIARAFYLEAKIIIMDEPTTALSSKEINFLFDIIKRMRKDTTFIFVSHKLNEIIGITDRVTVLKDGKYVDTVRTRDVDISILTSMMIGKSEFKKKLNGEIKSHDFENANVILEVKNLKNKKLKLENVSFKLHRGEILGVAGLLGSGRTELLNILFGLNNYDSGEIILGDKRVNFKNSRQAIRNGIGLITEERSLALFDNLTVGDNIVPVVIDRLAKAGWINNRKYSNLALKYKNILEINTPSIKSPILSLSGGNQQKALIARWLSSEIKVLLCDEPTKGVDIGSKMEIRRKLLELANQGVSIIYISSEFEELLKISDRIVIISGGVIVKEFNKNEVKNLLLKNLNDETYFYAAKEEEKNKIFIN